MSDNIKTARGHRAWVEAFSIFAKYEPDKSFTLNSAHDVIYSCEVHESEMEEEDVASLTELGWGWDDKLMTWYCFT